MLGSVGCASRGGGGLDCFVAALLAMTSGAVVRGADIRFCGVRFARWGRAGLLRRCSPRNDIGRLGEASLPLGKLQRSDSQNVAVSDRE